MVPSPRPGRRVAPEMTEDKGGLARIWLQSPSGPHGSSNAKAFSELTASSSASSADADTERTQILLGVSLRLGARVGRDSTPGEALPRKRLEFPALQLAGGALLREQSRGLKRY